MPRREQPLADDGDPLVRFAFDLRKLREKAGSPPYRELARLAHFSSTTLADAANGRKLPTLAVTLAYVRACDGDVAAWERRWREIALDTAPPAVEVDESGCPYAGLASFQQTDSDRFFGRETLTEDVLRQVRAHRFTVVFGPSGSGKSSLLRAGLLPNVTWPRVVFTPGAHPLQECAARLAALTSGSAAALHQDLEEQPEALHLTVLQATADSDVLIVVDQFEEVFTLCQDKAEREQFIAALATAASAPNSRTRVVLGVRADFYAHCSQHPELVAALRDSHVLVGPMTTEELRRAISKPAALAGCAVDNALLVRIIADAAGQPNALPLVSHALRETWRRRRGNTLILSGYEAAGGIHHALARTAEAVHTGLDDEQQRLSRAIFLSLVALGEGTEDTKRPVARQDLPAGSDAVLEALAAARLVTLDADTVEITHEALLPAWPRLRSWIDEDRAGLVVQRRLTDAATTWQREQQDPSALYRGSRLAAAKSWAQDHEPGPYARDFLAASDRRENRGTRLRRAAIAALAAFALIATAAAGYAFQQRDSANAERDRAVAIQTSSEASQTQATDTSLAAQLSLAAYRMQPDAGNYASLLSTQNTPLASVLTGHRDTIYAVAFSSDHRTMATGGQDHTIRLWNVANPAAPAPLGQPVTTDSWVYWLSFSPDGKTLASASRDHTARLWDVHDPLHPQAFPTPLAVHTDLVFSVAFSPDGRTLVTASADGTFALWDVSAPAHPSLLSRTSTGDKEIASASVSPNSQIVATSSHDHTVKLWEISNPQHPTQLGQPLAGHSDTVFASAFSPNGKVLATVSNDHTVLLWDISNPTAAVQLGQPLTGHSDSVYAVAFSPDGSLLATAGADHSVRLWNVTNPASPVQFGQPLLGHSGTVYWLAFSPDGHMLASAGRDDKVVLWDVASRHELGSPLTGYGGSVSSVAFSPDGKTLATSSLDGTVRFWDVTDPANPASLKVLTGHPTGVWQVAFSADGKILAGGSADDTVGVWDVADPRHVKTFGSINTNGGDVLGVAFSHHGRLLATANQDDTVSLWDVSDPAHPVQRDRLTGHTSFVYSVAFAPDDGVLASSSTDHALRLWNISAPGSATAIGAVTGHTAAIDHVTYSPDGKVLASASDDHTVVLTSTDATQAATAVCAESTGNLTTQQWRHYIPEVDYRSPC